MKKNYIWLGSLILAWAIYFILNKLLMQVVGSPFVSSLFLRVVTMVILTVFFVATKKIPLLKQIKGSLLIMTVVAVLAFAFDCLWNIGFMHSSLATGTVLMRSEIIFVCIISTFVIKEKHDWFDWALVFVMLIGVIFVLDINFSNLSFNYYDLLFIAGALINVISAYAIKAMQKGKDINIFVIVFFNNFVAMVCYGIINLFTGDIFTFAAVANINFSFVILLLFASLAQSSQMVTYYNSISLMPVWKVKAFTLIVPILCAIMGIWVFSDIPSITSVIGMVVVLTCTLFLVRNDMHRGKPKIGGDIK